MENNANKLTENFLNENEELIESSIKIDLESMRPNYLQEIRKPGCTPCMKNAMRHKYSNVIKNLLEKKQNQ